MIKQGNCLALLVIFPLVAVAGGDNPGNWPSPPFENVWVLSVENRVVTDTSLSIDTDTAEMAFATEKACNDFAKGLYRDREDMKIKHVCSKRQ